MANTDNALFINRPNGDNNLIIVNDGPYDVNPIFKKQANILGCASRTDCDRVIKASQVGNQVEAMVTRDACLARHYSSLLSCSEFHMKIEIPKCAFKGLELTDIIFNDPTLCSPEANFNGTHYIWNINYNDCGTQKGKGLN